MNKGDRSIFWKINLSRPTNPAYNSESLLANASESLDSASEMLSNFAAILEPAHRKTALGIAAGGYGCGAGGESGVGSC